MSTEANCIAISNDSHERSNAVPCICRYSTGSNLNTYSALIHQNFYSQETAPHPAVHVALNTGTEEGSEPGVKAFLG